MIVTICFIEWMIGVVMGTLDAWNRKVFHIMFMVFFVFLLVSCLIVQSQGNSVFEGWPWYYFICAVASVVFGMQCGKRMYEKVWRKNDI